MWKDAGLAAVDGFTGALAAPATELIMGVSVVTREAAIEALVKAADFSLKGYGKTLAEGSLRTFVEGYVMGFGHGLAETAMDEETWQKGIAEAIAKLTEGSLETGLEWAIMGAALGGPIAVGGKLITRAQVGGMVKELAAKGISTEGMTPSQIVRTNWALELEAAGMVEEGRMLGEMVKREINAAKVEAVGKGETPHLVKDPAIEGKNLDAARPAEGPGPERGLQEDRLGKDAWPSESEAQLQKWGAEEVPLPDGHKLMRIRERCYLCSENCPEITELYTKYEALIEANPVFKQRLSDLGKLAEMEQVVAYEQGLQALGKELDDAMSAFRIEGYSPGEVNTFRNFSKELAFGTEVVVYPGKKLYIFGRVGKGAKGTLSTTELGDQLIQKGVPPDQISVLNTQMPDAWKSFPIRTQNEMYWERINKVFCDDAIASGSDIPFLHDPRLENNIWNDIFTSTDAKFIEQCQAEGIERLEVFLHMEYEYFCSKGYTLLESGMLVKK